MKFGLDDKVIEDILKVFQDNWKIDCVVLFGSRAKGNYREGSDIDVAMKGRDITFDDILSLSSKLDDLNLPYEIDLINYSTIKDEDVIEHIDRVGIAFYERWKKYKISDIISLEYGKSLFDYRNNIGKYEVFGTNGKIGTSNKFLYDKPSLIIGRKGAYREVHLSKKPFFVIDTAFYTKNKIDELDTIFLYHWFKNIDINDMDSGSAIPSTSRDEVYDLDIYLPPLVEQVSITSILQSLDNKIDLLQRQNKTLEQLAETLFRQWFVEEASEDWEVGKVRDFACINKSSISKDYEYEYEYIEYLDTGSITEGIISEFQVFKLLDAPSRAQRIVRKNDLVYSLVRPIQRHYGILIEVKPNTVVSTGFCVINCHSISPFFMYLLLTIDDSVDYFDMVAEGSTSAYPSLKPSDIANFEFALPPKEKLHAFSEYTADAWNKISSNRIQIQTLTQLRDALLPKLMSGEMRVKM